MLAEPRVRSVLLVCFALATGCRGQERDSEQSVAKPPPSAPAAPASVHPTTTPAPTPLPPLPPGAKTQDERNTISVFQRAAPSVVFVTQKRLVVDWMAGRAAEVPAGSGSGFLWDDKGHVVTNFHVIQRARALTVTLFDQKTYAAQVVGVEPKKDIAVLKISAGDTRLVPLQLTQAPHELAVGQKTIAIGNPFGLDHTLTTGVVSAVGREVKGVGGVSIRDMVQTDAAINPGNSGGPLLDSSGRLIGMNTMIFSRSGAYAGIGFAVPTATIARVVPQLIKDGRVRQAGLGVRIDPTGRLERRLRIKGVVVLSVAPDSPAAKAGLRGLEMRRGSVVLGDVIVRVEKEKIDNYDDLYNALDGLDPGGSVSVQVVRGRKKTTLDVPLVELD